MPQAEAVRTYWTERAQESERAPSATTQDIHLRRLEIDTIVETLKAFDRGDGLRLLDLGCGDGFSTLEVADRLPCADVWGVDYSPGMIANATANLLERPGLTERVRFSEGDVTALDLPEAHFDVVITDRCLINLTSPEDQKRALSAIAKVVRPGGIYLAVENFTDGQQAMNAARGALGLPEIPVRWHNLYFETDRFVQWVEPHFEIDAFKDFASTYYLATRVIYSRLCQIEGVEPDYDHAIHQLAKNLPDTEGLSPVRMAVLRRREGAIE